MSFIRCPGRVVASLVAAVALSSPVGAQVEEGHARRVPWSGYWWPMVEGLMLEPLAQYDLVAGGKSAAAWEERTHPKQGAEKNWWGYCHAWSAAAVSEPEPTRSVAARIGDGHRVTLSVGHQKGLLTNSHYADPSNVYGERYNGDPEDDILDIYPDVLWKYLKLYVKQQGLPLIMDLDAGVEVWNYPVYAYKIVYEPTGGDNFRGLLTLYFADDAVPPDYVGTKVNARNYQFIFKMRGGAVVMGSGKWVGASQTDHPDFAWYPTKQQGENPYLDYQKVLKMIGRFEGPAPPAPPLTDPANPPQPVGHVPEPPAAPLPGHNAPPPGTVVTPTQLLTMIAHRQSKKSDFRFDITVDRFDGGKYKAGERYWVVGKAQKDGYLYLFHLDKEGNFKLVYPMPGQNNVVPAGKEFKVGSPADPDKAAFVCADSLGTQHVLGFITTRPLKFAGASVPEPKTGAGQQTRFHLNPQTKKVFRGLALQAIEGKTKPETVDKETGLTVDKLPFEFAMDEVAFYVGPRGKP